MAVTRVYSHCHSSNVAGSDLVSVATRRARKGIKRDQRNQYFYWQTVLDCLDCNLLTPNTQIRIWNVLWPLRRERFIFILSCLLAGGYENVIKGAAPTRDFFVSERLLLLFYAGRRVYRQTPSVCFCTGRVEQTAIAFGYLHPGQTSLPLWGNSPSNRPAACTPSLSEGKRGVTARWWRPATTRNNHLWYLQYVG